ATALDLRLQVEVGLLVELPPEAPQGQVGPGITTATRRRTAAAGTTRSSRGTRARGRRTGWARSRWAGRARRRSGAATASCTAPARRDRVPRAAVLPSVGVGRTLKREEAADCEGGGE